jgi:hypothetical protein
MNDLRGSYVCVAVVDGNVGQAIKSAVAGFQRRKKGMLPAYVWCPIGMMLPRSEVESWRQRGVTVSNHPRIPTDMVWAGPIDE